jgi:hypothetical protein
MNITEQIRFIKENFKKTDNLLTIHNVQFLTREQFFELGGSVPQGF